MDRMRLSRVARVNRVRLSGQQAAYGPPVFVKGTVIDSGTFSVTFDRAVDTGAGAGGFTGTATTSGAWQGDGYVSGQGTPTIVIVLISGGFASGDAVTIDFNGDGSVMGSPDGTPVAAFSGDLINTL